MVGLNGWKWSTPRFYVIAGAAIAIVAVYLLVFNPVPITGTIVAKCVVGIKDTTSYSIITITPYGATADDPAFSDVVMNEGMGLTVNSSLEQRMFDAGYTQIKYVVSIHVTSGKDTVNGIGPGDALGYFTGRTEFNSLRIWDVANFEVDRFSMSTVHLKR